MDVMHKEHVALKGLMIVYDMDNRMETINLICSPDEVSGTGRPVTEGQINGILEAIYGKKYERMLVRKVNYIEEPVECTLCFSSNELVAIGSENEKQYCYLQSGKVINEKDLYKLCKDEILAGMASKVDFHAKIIRDLISEMEKIRKVDL